MEGNIQKFDTENTDDIEKRWTRWKTNLNRYFAIKKIDQAAAKKNHLFFLGGDGIEDIYEAVANEADSYEQVIEKIDARILPKTNTELHLMQFRKISQFAGEPFNEFVQRLRDRAKFCEFGDAAAIAKEVKSQIIHGCSSIDLKKRALGTAGMTVEELITAGRTEESVDKQIKEMKGTHKHTQEQESDGEGTDQVNAIKRKFDKVMGQENRHNGDSRVNLAEMRKKGLCTRCGNKFPHEKTCPADGKECYKCGNTGHFKQFCASRKASSTHSKQARQLGQPKDDKLDNVLRAIADFQASHKEQQNTSSASDDDGRVWQIFEETNNDNVKKPKIRLLINGQQIIFLIDTGCPKFNVIDSTTYNAMGDSKPILKRSSLKLFPYGSSESLKVKGEFSTRVTSPQGKYEHLDFVVVNGNGGNIIGCESALKLKLIEFVAKLEPTAAQSNPKSEAFKLKLINSFPSVKELRAFLSSYRATPHSSTKVSPNDLLFRSKPSTSLLPNAFEDAVMFKKARENDKRAKESQARYANAKAKSHEHKFQVGDLVWVQRERTTKKDTTYYPEPFKIVEIKGVMATVKLGATKYARNTSMIKPYYKPTRYEPESDNEPEDEANVEEQIENNLVEQLGQSTLSAEQAHQLAQPEQTTEQAPMPASASAVQVPLVDQQIERRSLRTTKGHPPERLGISAVSDLPEDKANAIEQDQMDILYNGEFD